MLVAALLGLGTGTVAEAKSDLVSITMEPIWPATNDPGTEVLYELTVTRQGEGEIDLTLTCSGLPDGAVASFSVNPVRFVGQVPIVQTSILSIQCPTIMPTDPIPFTVMATDGITATTTTNLAGQTFDASFAANPASRPKLRLDLLGKRNMKIRGKGATAKTYRIEATPSLTNPTWGPIGLSSADGNGRFTFMDSDKRDPSWFYRAVGPVIRPQ